ncbi:MAG: hypothetical protein ACYDBP_13670 [Leptospirales bacterium]
MAPYALYDIGKNEVSGNVARTTTGFAFSAALTGSFSGIILRDILQIGGTRPGR